MHCTTFYSYKGGVGRTLALANVAARFAMRGKKVLIVDFDLEAPGITTLNFCSNAQGRPGVVDFIHAYLRDGHAPQARNFIHPCSSQLSDGERLAIDVMPAGDQSSAYGASFAKIDWRELYEERDGFLLMEDLRAQWAADGYDYVLIDSRTGLTDVSGLCTRQLPDSVVTIFFPNEQNLVGLTEMVRSVRASTARAKPPELLFVASRLPRLDDEDGVLERWLERFKSELKYSSQQICHIQQYDSLALLDQDIFVLSRPRTVLAKQYRKLSDLVSQLNVEDADGAVQYISTMRRLFSGKRIEVSHLGDPSNPYGIDGNPARLEKIEQIHSGDCVVQQHLAEHYYSARDFAHLEVVLRHGLLSTATKVEGGVPEDLVPRLHILRMRAGSETGDVDSALSAALAALECPGANEQMVVEALMLLVTADPAALPAPSDIPFFQAAPVENVMGVMRKFGISSREARYNCRIALQAKKRFGSDLLSRYQSMIELALIAGGEFDEALRSLGDSEDPDDLLRAGVSNAFNRTMALWGRDGKPNLALFRVLRDIIEANRGDQSDTANFQQCWALVCAVLKDLTACAKHISITRSLISARLGRREVSCWSFVEEPEEDFLEHCNQIELLAAGHELAPSFISRSAP